jgi:hypothetical protein
MAVARIRFGSVLEWLIAVVCIVAALGVGSITFRELRAVPAVTPVIAEEAPVLEAPAAVPPRAVSVPMLVLGDGIQLHVGERLSAIKEKVDPAWQLGDDALEQTPNGDRVTRLYERDGQQFLLVLEPIAPEKELRVAGIYLQ